MPEDNHDLALVQVSFPPLADDSPASCPVSVSEVLEYLAAEAPGGETLEPSDLFFLRTAQVADVRYWIWRFFEPDGGDEAYVTVAQEQDGLTCVGYDANYYGLTPEQFLLGDYHNVF